MSSLTVDMLRIVKRIAKAGKNEAERNNYPNLDVFIHLLDEIERVELALKDDK